MCSRTGPIGVSKAQIWGQQTWSMLEYLYQPMLRSGEPRGLSQIIALGLLQNLLRVTSASLYSRVLLQSEVLDCLQLVLDSEPFPSSAMVYVAAGPLSIELSSASCRSKQSRECSSFLLAWPGVIRCYSTCTSQANLYFHFEQPSDMNRSHFHLDPEKQCSSFTYTLLPSPC